MSMRTSNHMLLPVTVCTEHNASLANRLLVKSFVFIRHFPNVSELPKYFLLLKLMTKKNLTNYRLTSMLTCFSYILE